jgi:hypothetical protein
MELHEVFDQIQFSDGQVVEFPIDIIFPAQEIPVFLQDKQKKLVQDYVFVDLPLTSTEVLQNIHKILLTAAVDRNVVCYDEYALPGVFSHNLLAIMYDYFRRDKPSSSLSVNITDVFISADMKVLGEFKHFAKQLKVDLHPTLKPHVLDYYINALQASLPANKHNLVIAVNKDSGHFVMPYKNNKYGLAVLNNNSVLLGAY